MNFNLYDVTLEHETKIKLQRWARIDTKCRPSFTVNPTEMFAHAPYSVYLAVFPPPPQEPGNEASNCVNFILYQPATPATTQGVKWPFCFLQCGSADSQQSGEQALGMCVHSIGCQPNTTKYYDKVLFFPWDEDSVILRYMWQDH